MNNKKGGIIDITFEEIFNEVVEVMHHFTPKEEDYSKLTKYEDILDKTIDTAVEEVFKDLFSYEKTKSFFNKESEAKVKDDFKNWIKHFFEISNKEELYEFYKDVVKRGIKYVEKDFSPEYTIAILIKVGKKLRTKLEHELGENAQEIVDILEDLIERVILLNVAAYIHFEHYLLDYIGISKNLKKNTVN